jgi:U3 small nucleolar ribonucleoprotein protein LCP5
MAVDDSTAGLLTTLTAALESASSALPDDGQQFLPPADGISLLDIKNDLLLSYLQNLAFLVLFRLRHGDDVTGSDGLESDVIGKLVDLRVYLERGVRPLENKLKYQIDKVVRAAEEADRRASQKTSTDREPKKTPTTKTLNKGSDVSDTDSEDLESEGELDREMDGNISAAPRPAALLRNLDTSNKEASSTRSRAAATGAYKPPRITPTAMPEPPSSREREGPARKRRSQLLDEYIDEELSAAPRAQPSIGSNSTIVKHGRGAMSSRDRERERERNEYEERNFVRLPAPSKAEKKKGKLQGQRDPRDLFGGEDWTGLGGLGDRINRTVAGRSRGEGGNVLERREKRRRDPQDGPRGDGVGIGETFEKRRKVVQQRAEKKTRRKG